MDDCGFCNNKIGRLSKVKCTKCNHFIHRLTCSDIISSDWKINRIEVTANFVCRNCKEEIQNIRGQSMLDQRRPQCLPFVEPGAGVSTRSGRIPRVPVRFSPSQGNAPIVVQRPRGWTERAAASPQIENVPMDLEQGIDNEDAQDWEDVEGNQMDLDPPQESGVQLGAQLEVQHLLLRPASSPMSWTDRVAARTPLDGGVFPQHIHQGNNDWTDSDTEEAEEPLNKTATPTITPTTRWEIIQKGTNKKKPLLVDWQGHRYVEKSFLKNNTWRCSRHDICNAKVRQVPVRDDYQQSDFVLHPHEPGMPHFDPPVFGTEWQAKFMRDTKAKAAKNLTKSSAVIYEKELALMKDMPSAAFIEKKKQ